MESHVKEFITKRLAGGLSSLCFAIGIWCIGTSAFDTEAKIYTNYLVPSDCNYKLPEGYCLYKDEVRGFYCIGLTPGQRNYFPYLYVTSYTFGLKVGVFGSESEATIFKDSCDAKGFAKKFFMGSTKYKILNVVK